MSSAFPQIESLAKLLEQTYQTAEKVKSSMDTLVSVASQNASTLMQFVPGLHQYKYLEKFVQNLGLTLDNLDIIVVNLRKMLQEKASGSSSFIDVLVSFLAGSSVDVNYVDPFSDSFGGYAFSLRALLNGVQNNSAVTKVQNEYYKFSYVWGSAKDMFSSLLSANKDISFIVGGVDDPASIQIGLSLPSTAFPNSPIYFSLGVKFDPNKDIAIKDNTGVALNASSIGMIGFQDLDSVYSSMVFAVLPAIRDKNNKYVYPFPVCMWNSFIGAISYIRASADYVGSSGTPDADYVAVTSESGIPILVNTTGSTKFQNVMLPPYAIAPLVLSIYGASKASVFLIPAQPFFEDRVPSSLTQTSSSSSQTSSTSTSSTEASTSTSTASTSTSTSSQG